jgi:oligopeptide transport system substrate-binding protein
LIDQLFPTFASMRKALIYLSLFSLLLACHRNFEQPVGKTVFRYNEAAGISSLDPAFARDQANIWACNLLYNGLVQLDENLLVQPAIAQSWSISEDGKSYHFQLRNEVYFHDWLGFPQGKGRQVLAADVVYSLQRVLKEETLSPGAVWLKEVIAMHKGTYAIQAIDSLQLSIELNKPFAAFLSRLSMPYFSIVPREAVEYYGSDFGRNPVGTGPFYFKTFKEGVKMVVLKNENYFEFEGDQRLPYLDAVAVSFIIDKQSVFLEFIKGNLDFLSGIDPSYKDELLQANGQLNPKYKEELCMLSKPYLNTEYLGFMVDTSLLPTKSPIRIKKVRQAINYGFNRKKMMRYLRNNAGYPGNMGFVPPGMPGFADKQVQGYDYQAGKARKLLAEAGFANGVGLEGISLATTSSYVDIGKYIQQELAKLGIKLEVEIYQPAALRQMVANNKIPLFRGSWIADYADAENYLALFYSKNFSPGGANYTHFSSPEYDRLYEQAIVETDEIKRLNMYFQLDSMVTEQAPFVVLYYDKVLRFTHTNIVGLGINSMNMLDLKRVRKKTKEE